LIKAQDLAIKRLKILQAQDGGVWEAIPALSSTLRWREHFRKT